jgi:hypothetical protein
VSAPRRGGLGLVRLDIADGAHLDGHVADVPVQDRVVADSIMKGACKFVAQQPRTRAGTDVAM